MNKESLEKTLKHLRKIRLPAMAEQLMMMIENNELVSLSVEEVLERISEGELMSRKNNTITRLKKDSKLSQSNARLEDVDYRPERKLNKSVIEQLRTNDYISKHRNVILLGACGTGKSYLANALGNHACEDLYKTYYVRLFEFLDECNHSQLFTGSVEEKIKKYSKYDVLIIDDFLIHELEEKEANNLFKLIEYRWSHKTTIICSQLEPLEWHGRLGGTLLADAILDRIIPSSHQLVLEGKSLR